MRKVTRRLRGHFGTTAKKVVLRPSQPWYSQLLVVGLLVLFGYLVGYWQYSGVDYDTLMRNLNGLLRDNQTLEAKTVYRERQLQVERAAQRSLTEEITALQDETMRLKEELAFYRGILSENATSGELKLHSFKLNKGKAQNQYEYHVLLIQSGRHDKWAQGKLMLNLRGMKDGEPVTLPLRNGQDLIGPVKINFKYYQRINGQFTLADVLEEMSVELTLTESGARQPKITQQLDLPK
jgi:hypothetical protein